MTIFENYIKFLKMKKIIIALLVFSSLAVVSQESVLLRVNYNKGDKYVVSVTQTQSMGTLGGSSMNMNLNMTVSEIEGETFKTETKVKSIYMFVNQGGQTMTYDSNVKDEDLDQTGKMFKSQFAPLMNTTIYSTLSNLGKNVETKIIPAIQRPDQLKNISNGFNYPKEKVSVGSTWSSEESNQGITIKTTYKVVKIENGKVYLDLTGKISGAGSGTLTGKSEIDISTGTQTKTEIDMNTSISGRNVKSGILLTTKKG